MVNFFRVLLLLVIACVSIRQPVHAQSTFHGDLDHNGEVNLSDNYTFFGYWGASGCGHDADFNGDCRVNIHDYMMLVINFGKRNPLTNHQNDHPTVHPISTEPPLLPPPTHKENIGGSVQIRCPVVKREAVDPIVFPGSTTSSHEHIFFGNTGVTAASSYNQLTAGGTSCEEAGDTAAYWAPTLYDSTGIRIPARQVRAYYYPHTKNTGIVVPFPPDLRIIAGDRDAKSPQSTGVVDWLCRDRTNQSAGRPLVVVDPPTCLASQYLSLSLRFPDCLAKQPNGQPMLDSTDHRRHMAYANETGVCPTTHPIKVPKLRISIVYEHPTFHGGNFSLGGAGSDPKALPRFGMHADFWNTWQQAELEKLVSSFK